MRIKNYIKFMRLAHSAYSDRFLTKSHDTMVYDMPLLLSNIRAEMGEQNTQVFCNCGYELTSTNSYIDTDTDEDIAIYKCSYCGEESKFNFGIAPVAIKVDEK